MDWTNERYVRAYTRDTADYLVLSWQARGLWWEVLRKADRSGVIATSHGARGIAALVRWPLEVVQEALMELLADGCIRECEGGFVLPNYLDAQEATASTAQRKRESRESRRLQKVTIRDHEGTNRDQMSRAVTSGHAESQDVTPNLAEPSLTDPREETSPPPLTLSGPELPKAERAVKRKKPAVPIPDDWKPRDHERRKAAELGLDADREAMRFRDHHASKGNTFVDHDAAFRMWLGNSLRFQGGNGAAAPSATAAIGIRPTTLL